MTCLIAQSWDGFICSNARALISNYHSFQNFPSPSIMYHAGTHDHDGTAQPPGFEGRVSWRVNTWAVWCWPMRKPCHCPSLPAGVLPTALLVTQGSLPLMVAMEIAPVYQWWPRLTTKCTRMCSKLWNYFHKNCQHFSKIFITQNLLDFAKWHWTSMLTVY